LWNGISIREGEVGDKDGGTEKEEDLGGGKGGREDVENFESSNSCSDVEADSITEIKEGRGGAGFPSVSTTVSSSSSTGDVSPDELGLEPKSFQGSSGSLAPTFPLRTFLTPKAGTKLIFARVFKEGKEGRDLNAGRWCAALGRCGSESDDDDERDGWCGRRRTAGGECGVVGGECGIAGGECWIAGGECGIAGGECWIAGGECGIAGGECGIAGGECGIAGGECWIAGGECWIVGGECGIAGGELSGCCGCGCEVVGPQPAELLNDAIEGNEDLVPIPLNPEKLVGVGEVDIDRDVIAGPLGGVEVLEASSSRGSKLLSFFKRRERGEYFTSPADALPDNCRQIFPPNPVRLAKGSSSNKKSGGGELRGGFIELKLENELWLREGMTRGFDFIILAWGTKERDGERDDRGGGEMIVGDVVSAWALCLRCNVYICGLATSWVCRAMNDKDLLKFLESRRDGLGKLKLDNRRFRFPPILMSSYEAALSSSSDWEYVCWVV
jgi:hypothetical protein